MSEEKQFSLSGQNNSQPALEDPSPASQVTKNKEASLGTNLSSSDFSRDADSYAKEVNFYDTKDSQYQFEKNQTQEELLTRNQEEENLRWKLKDELNEALTPESSGRAVFDDKTVSSFINKPVGETPSSGDKDQTQPLQTHKVDEVGGQPRPSPISTSQTVNKQPPPGTNPEEIIFEAGKSNKLEESFIKSNAKKEEDVADGPKDRLRNRLMNEDMNVDLRPLRTYKDDISRIMKEKKGSILDIATAENTKRVSKSVTSPKLKLNTEEIPKEEKQYLKKVSIIILSTILFVFGAGSIFYFYGRSTIPPIGPNDSQSLIIFVDENKNFEVTSLSKQQILSELVAIKNGFKLNQGRILNIAITKIIPGGKDGVLERQVSANEFLNAIEVSAPLAFLRSLTPDFIIGIHSIGTNQPFLILRTSFYESAFAGMIDWEGGITEDLAPLFDSERNNESIDKLEFKLAKPIFTDIVIKNKDVRILKGIDGETALLYSFIDRNTIVITTNEDTFGEVFTRLTSSKTVK